jgi:hypothetical protein
VSQNDGETETIDGDTYKVLMLDPLVATDLLADIGEILGPSLAAIGSALGGEDQIKSVLENTETGMADFGPALERAVGEFFKRFSKAKQREVIGILSKVTSVVKPNGEEPGLDKIFSSHFRGRLGALYKWLGFALKVQFKDFFSASAPAIAAAVRRAGLGK